MIPFHGLIVYFKLKRFTGLERSTSVINTIITEKKTNPLTGGGRDVSSNFSFVGFFRKVFGCLIASCTVLF